MIHRAQGLLDVQGASCVMDIPNLLAVPNALLRSPVQQLGLSERAMAEASIEFMLRGY